MRRQVICQQCGAVNATEAVVCAACGTRLEHPERRWYNRLRDSALFQRLRTAPIRAAKTLSRRIWTIVLVLAILLVMGVGVVCFGLFCSVGWEEFPEPGNLNEQESRMADAFVDAVVEGRGGVFPFTPASATVVARRLLTYDPEAEAARKKPSRRSAPRPVPKKQEPEPEPEPESPLPAGGLEEFAESARESFRNCRLNMGFVQAGDYRYILTVSSKIGDMLPWRIMATFTAAPDGDGEWHLSGCQLGSWTISAKSAYKLSHDIWREANPHEQLSAAIRRIKTCRMFSQQGVVQGGAFVVVLRPAR